LTTENSEILVFKIMVMHKTWSNSKNTTPVI